MDKNKTNTRKTKRSKVTTNKYQGVTIKDKAKGKVTKQQVKQLKKEHSGKDEETSSSREAEEAEWRAKKC